MDMIKPIIQAKCQQSKTLSYSKCEQKVDGTQNAVSVIKSFHWFLCSRLSRPDKELSMGKIPALGENNPSLKTVLGTAEPLHPWSYPRECQWHPILVIVTTKVLPHIAKHSLGSSVAEIRFRITTLIKQRLWD